MLFPSGAGRPPARVEAPSPADVARPRTCGSRWTLRPRPSGPPPPPPSTRQASGRRRKGNRLGLFLPVANNPSSGRWPPARRGTGRPPRPRVRACGPPGARRARRRVTRPASNGASPRHSPRRVSGAGSPWAPPRPPPSGPPWARSPPAPRPLRCCTRGRWRRGEREGPPVSPPRGGKGPQRERCVGPWHAGPACPPPPPPSPGSRAGPRGRGPGRAGAGGRPRRGRLTRRCPSRQPVRGAPGSGGRCGRRLEGNLQEGNLLPPVVRRSLYSGKGERGEGARD